MREIKFRGVRVDNGEWIYGFYGYKEETEKSFLMVETINANYPSYFTDYEVVIETVGQYTGLKDKNGKEIYEGDIVKAWSQGSCGIFQVKWREDGGGNPCYILYPAWHNGETWRIASSREKDGQCYDRRIEVIGDIYRNPELMEVNE